MTRRAAGCVAALLLCGGARSAAPQGAPVAVVAVGEGRSFSAALSVAVRMAVESGAGATVTGVVSSNGNSLNADSVRAVSRGVVTRYALLDSSRTPGEVRVRILAMVSRIAERDAVGARGRQVAAQGDLWTANAALDAARRADEGRLLAELFSAKDHQPSPYEYEVETGPPVPSGTKLRLRLRVIRTPSAAYAALRDRAHAILAAIAGPAGVRKTALPPAPIDHVVRACVSHCANGERRLLNPRAALDDTDSLGRFDPPVVTATGVAPVQTLFPELPTVGGFAVAFTDSARKRQTFVHVRSTRGYLAVAGYLRTTFDDARFRLEIGNRSVDVLESFRAPATGQPAPRFEATARPAAAMEVTLAQGFKPWTSGGPGAATSLGSPYVVLSLPAADDRRADTAYVDIMLSPAEVSGVTELSVAPLGAVSDGRPAVNERRPAGQDIRRKHRGVNRSGAENRRAGRSARRARRNRPPAALGRRRRGNPLANPRTGHRRRYRRYRFHRADGGVCRCTPARAAGTHPVHHGRAPRGAHRPLDVGVARRGGRGALSRGDFGNGRGPNGGRRARGAVDGKRSTALPRSAMADGWFDHPPRLDGTPAALTESCLISELRGGCSRAYFERISVLVPRINRAPRPYEAV